MDACFQQDLKISISSGIQGFLHGFSRVYDPATGSVRNRGGSTCAANIPRPGSDICPLAGTG
jgi:hypothetical protein